MFCVDDWGAGSATAKAAFMQRKTVQLLSQNLCVGSFVVAEKEREEDKRATIP